MRLPDLEHCPSRPDATSVLWSRARASVDRGDVSAIITATRHEYGWPGLCLLALLQARVIITRWGYRAAVALAPDTAVSWYVSAVTRDMHGALRPDELAPEELFDGLRGRGQQLIEALARIGRRLQGTAVLSVA